MQPRERDHTTSTLMDTVDVGEPGLGTRNPLTDATFRWVAGAALALVASAIYIVIRTRPADVTTDDWQDVEVATILALVAVLIGFSAYTLHVRGALAHGTRADMYPIYPTRKDHLFAESVAMAEYAVKLGGTRLGFAEGRRHRVS